MEVVCHGSAMERRHGSDASRKRHRKGVMEVMRHGKRHGKCVMEASRKVVMAVVCHGSVMENFSG